MRYTNINILDGERRFRYIIEYDDSVIEANSNISYSYDSNIVNFLCPKVDLIREGNDWRSFDKDTVTDLLPEHIDMSTIRIYFPEYSIETYEKSTKYALTLNMWIHDTPIYLGSFLVDRKDAVACDNIITAEGVRYYEYIKYNIINPWTIMYSDEWKEFRQVVCGEESRDELEINDNDSSINVSLHPVEENDDKYIKLDNYVGGQNSINLSTFKDYLSYHVERESQYGYEERINSTILFNSAYDQDYEGFKLYMKETYNIEDFIIRYEFVIKDKDNIYKILSKIHNDITCTVSRDELKFDSWSGYKEGICLISSVDIFTDYKEDEDLSIPNITLFSNEISFTPDIIKYYIGEQPFNHVTLSLINMNTYNINAVNKIVKQVVQVERPNDYKSNILKPVYYKVKDIAMISLHPAVTENICLNLDAYKSSVESFIIQIEGVNFTERARTNAGVIFKIVGSSLPNINTNGIYYILNQDSELVTMGKYTYEV